MMYTITTEYRLVFDAVRRVIVLRESDAEVAMTPADIPEAHGFLVSSIAELTAVGDYGIAASIIDAFMAMVPMRAKPIITFTI